MSQTYLPGGARPNRRGNERPMSTTDEARQALTGALAAIVESSQDAIFRKTLDGVIESWNAGAQNIYG